MHKLFPYLDLTTCENCENEKLFVREKKLFVREKKPVVYSEVKTKKNTTHHLIIISMDVSRIRTKKVDDWALKKSIISNDDHEKLLLAETWEDIGNELPRVVQAFSQEA